jgi:tRNA-splicing ligase RtcB
MITGRDLIDWGVKGPAIKTGLRLLVPNPKDFGRAQIEAKVRDIVADPSAFLGDCVPWVASLAAAMASKAEEDAKATPIRMSKNHCPLTIFGDSMIEPGAIGQIHVAAKLPISVRAALMPDAHQGYGIPIGGVLATDNVVIPWAVGVDISCRMQMTIFDIPAKDASGMKDRLVNVLSSNTVFGAGQDIDVKVDSRVLDDVRFDLPSIRGLHLRDLATRQCGTSGGGNHFVSFGFVSLPEFDGERLAVLSHSGSRGVGYKIADVFSKMAEKECPLPGDARRLAWLRMDSDAGREYWDAMMLAADFAKACHDVIHGRITRAIKAERVGFFENVHNLAWRERLVDGRDVIVHRKGATPAHLGVYGIIPGSMTTPVYVCRGKGNEAYLFSSSHGAGRLMSRKAAKEQFTMAQMRGDLDVAGVTLIGGSLDECSMAYKDVTKVMACQSESVDVIGSFRSFIVRMAGESAKPWEKDIGE